MGPPPRAWRPAMASLVVGAILVGVGLSTPSGTHGGDRAAPSSIDSGRILLVGGFLAMGGGILLSFLPSVRLLRVFQGAAELPGLLPGEDPFEGFREAWIRTRYPLGASLGVAALMVLHVLRQDGYRPR